MAGTQWFLFKNGTCATNHFESGGFVKSDPGVPHPDIELQFVPLVVREAGESELIQHGYQVNCLLTMIRPYFRHIRQDLSLGRWWDLEKRLNKRIQYLQGLLITGLLTFCLQTGMSIT